MLPGTPDFDKLFHTKYPSISRRTDELYIKSSNPGIRTLIDINHIRVVQSQIMYEYARLYDIRPEAIRLESLPKILNRQLMSGEPVDSPHNSGVVQATLGKSELNVWEQQYIFKIYLHLSEATNHLGEARGKLKERHEELFRNRPDRDTDLDILDVLLNSSTWGKYVTTPFRRDNDK